MPKTIKIIALDGNPIEYVDKIIGQGGMKDVYFSPDKSYVVAFFRDTQDFNARDRAITIAGVYRDRILNQPGGDYWRDLYCCPTNVVEHNGVLGIVCPTYHGRFFFSHGSTNNDALGLRGKEKQGKWFASAKSQNRFLAPTERGDWYKYFLICIKISRAVRRMHAAGLAHSDLSYKNVLVDPITGSAAIIDIDGLVVPGKYPPDVLGTPDFIAPEVMSTIKLPLSDPNRRLPSRDTDKHALAVLIYMYLLYRHPLRGGKVHDLDANRDEELSMGEKALFVENPTNKSNAIKLNQLHPGELPQADTCKTPYTILGPYLRALIERAFIAGLHNPNLRPTADEWEYALLKTIDLLQPCSNPNCWHKWYVFDNTTTPKCSFCGTTYKGELPVLNLYSSRKVGSYTPDNYRLMVYNNQYLYQWHVNRNVSPNEKLLPEQKKPVGYFVYHEGKWLLINQTLQELEDKTNGKMISIGQSVELTDGKQILLSKADGGRLIIVQIANKK